MSVGVRRHRLPVLLLAFGLAACEKREVTPESSQAAAPEDSAMPASGDLLPTDSLKDSTSAAAPTYIGRDSAFGPLFAVDSTGKMVELPVRRP